MRLTHAGDPPKNLHQVCALRDLLSLSLGESGLTDYTFLSQLPTSLEDLSLAEAPRGKRSFTFLSRLKGLRTLTLIGHAADVEVVGELARLRQLNFQSVSPTSLRFLVDLPELRALRLALGGLRSLDGLEDLARLEYLHIWQVRHLDDLAAVAELEALETLFLQALRNVKSLPPLARLTRLKTVWLDTMTRLRDFRGIAQAPNLSNFTFIAATNCRPSDFTPLLRHPTLQTMRVGFGSRRTNDTFQAMMAAAGKREPEPRSQGSVGVQPHN